MRMQDHLLETVLKLSILIVAVISQVQKELGLETYEI